MPFVETVRDATRSAVQFLNRPAIKEGIKNISGLFSFTFGLFEAYDIYCILRGRSVSTDSYLSGPKWLQTVNKIIIVCAKISLILSGAVSRPGICIITTLLGSFFSTAQVQQMLGTHTYKVNPWGFRHIGSVAAVILALPSIVQSVCKCIAWAYRKICCRPNTSFKLPSDRWLTDTKVRSMAFFNTIFSRPVLHIGNRIAHLI